MSTITKEQAQKIIEASDEVITALAGKNEDVHPESDSMLRLWDDLNDRYAPPEVVRELARIALASLEAEPVKRVNADQMHRVCLEANRHLDKYGAMAKEVNKLLGRTAPPAPVSVPDLLEQFAEFMAAESIKSGDYPDGWQCKASNAAHEYAQNIRAAMLQGADTELQRKAAIHDVLCAKYNVESLADFVDWQRNHIAELEAAPPAPVGHGEAAVMPDYPGYALTQRECFEAGKKARLAELVTTTNKLPAIGWLRADYQDDNRGLRGNAPLFVLGKKDPSTVWGLDYIPLTSNSPVIPDGWALVPEEPTHEMLEAGDEQFGTYDVYRRMIAASPQQEVKP